jgi:hypothetical protein
MGANEFTCRATGKTANDAFAAAKEEARYESGHGGYSGTVAEKSSFKMAHLRAGETPSQAVDRYLEDGDSFVQDKWGPAGCLEVGPDPKEPGKKVYVFFGFASS